MAIPIRKCPVDPDHNTEDAPHYLDACTVPSHDGKGTSYTKAYDLIRKDVPGNRPPDVLFAGFGVAVLTLAIVGIQRPESLSKGLFMRPLMDALSEHSSPLILIGGGLMLLGLVIYVMWTPRWKGKKAIFEKARVCKDCKSLY